MLAVDNHTFGLPTVILLLSVGYLQFQAVLGNRLEISIGPVGIVFTIMTDMTYVAFLGTWKTECRFVLGRAKLALCLMTLPENIRCYLSHSRIHRMTFMSQHSPQGARRKSVPCFGRLKDQSSVTRERAEKFHNRVIAFDNVQFGNRPLLQCKQRGWKHCSEESLV